MQRPSSCRERRGSPAGGCDYLPEERLARWLNQPRHLTVAIVPGLPVASVEHQIICHWQAEITASHDGCGRPAGRWRLWLTSHADALPRCRQRRSVRDEKRYCRTVKPELVQAHTDPVEDRSANRVNILYAQYSRLQATAV